MLAKMRSGRSLGALRSTRPAFLAALPPCCPKKPPYSPGVGGWIPELGQGHVSRRHGHEPRGH